MLTDSVICITWNTSNFHSSNWLLKILSFFASRFRLWKNLKEFNFQSSNIFLRNCILFANRFRVWYNLNYLTFRAWLACLKNSTLPRTDSFYEITCYISNFQSSKSWLKKLHFFANRFCHLYNLKFQGFRAQTDSWKISVFLRTVFVFKENWKNSIFQSSNSLPKNSIISANQFRVWYYLNYLRFRFWLACVKNSTIPRTDTFYEITCYISKFQSSKSSLKKLHFFAARLHFFANRFCNFYNLKNFTIS